jgi:Flp pilus assembly protein TadG
VRDDGGATIEAVLWIPVIFLVFGLAVDFAMVFHGQSQALRVLQDANRNVSIGRLNSTSEAETFVENRLVGLSTHANASSAIASGVVTTTVTMPIADLQMLGLFRGLDSGTVTVSAEHLIENWGS